MRGELDYREDADDSFGGSSPRARGAVRLKNGELGGIRFIPACAGSSWAPCGPMTSSTVHPHVRGEQMPVALCWPSSNGSSPRARGADHRQREKHRRSRFIPTCAGSRRYRQLDRFHSSVHPHVRGEQAHGVAPDGMEGGSSPRARGAVLQVRGQEHRRRFIPTCAGSRASISWAMLALRFIPTCAGSRHMELHQMGWKAVHPRVRGEQQATIQPTDDATGSSPRARGAENWATLAACSGLFIPACAGSRRVSTCG